MYFFLLKTYFYFYLGQLFALHGVYNCISIIKRKVNRVHRFLIHTFNFELYTQSIVHHHVREIIFCPLPVLAVHTFFFISVHHYLMKLNLYRCKIRKEVPDNDRWVYILASQPERALVLLLENARMWGPHQTNSCRDHQS